MLKPLPATGEQQPDVLEYSDDTLEPSSEASLVARVDILSEQGRSVRANEDAVYADPDRSLAGVFDGVSDIVGFRTTDGLTGGAMAASIAGDTLESSTEQQSLTDILLAANRTIDELQSAHGIDPDKKEARFCTTAAVARVRRAAEGNTIIDLAQVADSVAIVIYEDGHAEAPLGLYDQDEETMQLWVQLVAEGLQGTDIRQDPRMEDKIAATRRESNVSYGVLNGEPEAANFIRSATIPAEGVKMVILISDGLFIPKEDPAAPEDWNAYAQLVADGGLQALHQHVREIEQSDPDLLRYPRPKISDDASGAVLHLR